MQTNLLWTGREYYSLENCLVNSSDNGIEITSTIIGTYEKKIYKVEYRIITNREWETLLVDLSCRHNGKTQSTRLESDGKGCWRNKGEKAEELQGCIDVDISLTPFTNTLPINRLRLGQNEERQIQVVYCDLLKEQIKPVRQKYSCLSKTMYHYQNVPNDFEAIILVDEAGLVVDYPGLFVRTASANAHDYLG